MHFLNQLLFKDLRVFKKRIPLVSLLWFTLAFLTVLAQLLKHSYNNFLIFRGVFWHALDETNLYTRYTEYFDVNHYGPFFSVVIAPFAVLPATVGMMLWGMVNTAFLYYAVNKLPFTGKEKSIVLWICLLELLTSLHNLQFNPSVAALLILAYVFVKEKKDALATLCIIAGVAIKLYTIAGLAFFFLSDRKTVFLYSCFIWSAVVFALPMLISSPSFVIHSYGDWYQSLVEKNSQNLSVVTLKQDISVGGMIRRLTHNYSFNSFALLSTAAITLLIQTFIALRLKSKEHWLLLLSSLLVSVVIFSSSSESATYIMALAGVAIWYVVSAGEYPKAALALLLLVIFFTSVCSTDLVPHYIKSQYVIKYALKALPCFVVWVFLLYQMVVSLVQRQQTGSALPISIKTTN